MRWKSVGMVLVGILVFLTVMCAFTGLAYEEDLVGNYAVWAVDAIEQAAIVEKQGGGDSRGVIDSMVCAYGWNEDFIIARQHPPHPDDHFRIDTGTTHWHIIEVKTGRLNGPLTQEEFGQLRDELQVPPELKFTKILLGSR